MLDFQCSNQKVLGKSRQVGHPSCTEPSKSVLYCWSQSDNVEFESTLPSQTLLLLLLSFYRSINLTNLCGVPATALSMGTL